MGAHGGEKAFWAMPPDSEHQRFLEDADWTCKGRPSALPRCSMIGTARFRAGYGKIS